MNNSRITNKLVNGSRVTSNQITNINFTPSINQATDEQRVGITPNNASNQGLITRGIENACSINLKKDLRLLAHDYLIKKLNLIVGFIKKNVDNNYEIDFGNDRTLEDLLEKLGEINYFMWGTKQAELYDKFLEEKLKPELLNIAIKDVEKFGGLDNARNIHFSLVVIEEIFRKSYEFDNERLKVSNLMLNMFDIDNCNEGYDKLGQVITEIKKMINDKYYSLFRILLNLDINVYEKAKGLLIYSGLSCNKLSDEDIFQNSHAPGNFERIPNSVCYISKLQIFIDVLTKITQHPKNLSNLEMALKECKICSDYFEEDLSTMRLAQKNQGTSPFIEDYDKFRMYLKRLTRDLTSIIENIKRNLQRKIEDNKPIPISTGLSNKKQQQPPRNNSTKKGQNKKGKQNPQLLKSVQTKVATSAGKQQTNVSVTPKKEAIITNILPNETLKQGDDEKNINSEVIATQEIRNNEIPSQKQAASQINILTINPPIEDNFEDVEKETSELFKVMRGWIELSQEKKLALKAKKEKEALEKKKAEKAAEEKKETTVSIEKKPMPAVIELKPKKKTILNTILSGKSCHLILKGEQIESLIKALGGDVTAGGKNKFDITWKGKRTGEYEVLHDRDPRGYLTAEFVNRVGHAILEAVRQGYIAEDTIAVNCPNIFAQIKLILDSK